MRPQDAAGVAGHDIFVQLRFIRFAFATANASALGVAVAVIVYVIDIILVTVACRVIADSFCVELRIILQFPTTLSGSRLSVPHLRCNQIPTHNKHPIRSAGQVVFADGHTVSNTPDLF